MVLLSLPSLRKQAEKTHQWDLKLDIPISILAFIFLLCCLCYDAYNNTGKKKNPAKIPLVLS